MGASQQALTMSKAASGAPVSAVTITSCSVTNPIAGTGLTVTVAWSGGTPNHQVRVYGSASGLLATVSSVVSSPRAVTITAIGGDDYYYADVTDSVASTGTSGAFSNKTQYLNSVSAYSTGGSTVAYPAPINVTCTIDGWATTGTSYQWEYNYSVSPGWVLWVTTQSATTGVTGPPGGFIGDQWSFRCTASNNAGSILSSPFTVTVV